jgi:hypothetical protein
MALFGLIATLALDIPELQYLSKASEKTRTFLSFNSEFAARVSKWRAGRSAYPASMRNCTICLGGMLPALAFWLDVSCRSGHALL